MFGTLVSRAPGKRSLFLNKKNYSSLVILLDTGEAEQAESFKVADTLLVVVVVQVKCTGISCLGGAHPNKYVYR